MMASTLGGFVIPVFSQPCAWLIRAPAAALDSQAKHAIPRPFGQDPMNTKTSTAAVAPSSRRGDEVPMTRAHHDRMANAIRALAMDAVEQAKSGHPGLPMGAADIATVLFTQVLKFDPADPAWPDRDRFVLSAGHGSMLVYALLHLVGYENMTIGEIKRDRKSTRLNSSHLGI